VTLASWAKMPRASSTKRARRCVKQKNCFDRHRRVFIVIMLKGNIRKFHGIYGSFTEYTEVSRKFHGSFTEYTEVSRNIRKFHRSFTEVSRNIRKFHGICGLFHIS